MAFRKTNNSLSYSKINYYRNFTVLLVNLVLTCLFIISCQDTGEDRVNSVPASNLVITRPAILVEKLSNKVRETSGLAEFDNLIWTINDSGGGNILFGLDKKSGKIVRKIVVKNAKNHDWEAMASDKDFIYIGDVGNNKGNRGDLRVYKVSKNSLTSGNTEAKAEAIHFIWPDQKIFFRTKRRTRFDCEALISYGDSLVLFTKDWFTHKTRMYSLPKEPGTYEAVFLDAFKADGLITGADRSEDGNILVLSGYSNYYPFLWIFQDFDGKDFFKGKAIRVEYPDFHDVQTEAVLFMGIDSILVSAERSGTYPPRIYYFSWSGILEDSEK